MRLVNLVLITFLFVFAGCATNAIIKDVQAPTVIPLETANTKPIQFKKIVVKINRGQPIGAWQGGILCVPNGPITWKGGRVNIDSDEFTEAFQDELKKFNFQTVGDTSALFEDPSTWKSEILVAGLVTDLKTNVCYPMAGFGDYTNSKGDAYIKVEWQIYSKLDRKVVHTLFAEGDGKQTEAIQGGNENAILNAFAESVQALLADGKFRKIVMQEGKSVANTTTVSQNQIVASISRAKPMPDGKRDLWSNGVVTVFAGSGHGSGFVVADNLILTNHHVAGNAKNATIKTDSGIEFVGEVVRSDSFLDIALIKTEVMLPNFFKINRNLPKVGSEVFAIGSPLDESLKSTISKGIVSAIRDENGKKLIQSDVNVIPGNSGGPLLNAKGDVIGITVSGIRINQANQGINFFIPISDALSKLNLVL